MKKGFLLLLFMSFGAICLAQINFGPKIGYNSTKLSLDRNDIESDLRNNFQFGAFLRIGKKIYVQPEINWVSQGSIYKSSDLNPITIGSSTIVFEQEVKMRTIQVPVLVGIKVIDFKAFNFRVMAGPTASFVTKTEVENKIDGGTIAITDEDVEDTVWSFQVGAGIDFLKATLDIRYNFGINNVISNVDILGENFEFSSKTSGFNVTLGLKIL